MAAAPLVCHPTIRMSRESERRIRDLCQKIIASEQESPEFSPAVRELRTAIREHLDGVRSKVADLAFLVKNESGSKAAD